MKRGFDNEKYIKLQAEKIRERINFFGGKLYLEFGGKLFDDYHASRVLPGFLPDAKIQMLKELRDDVEILVVVNALDIISNKVRGDIDIPYSEDVLRLTDIFKDFGFYVSSVIITRYAGQLIVDNYIKRLENLGIKCYRHQSIDNYPYDVDYVVSDDGLGKNEYVQTSKPLVVVTAPGPGSGKMATCLSQMYHDNSKGIKSGYAKFETFPVWNLPLKHPVNLAYEAATVDLNDANVIDHFHLEAYGKTTVNYNRDIESFPTLQAIMDKIMGKCPYNSPTDMGVNMVGYAIFDDAIVREAANNEIIRRYFTLCEENMRYGNSLKEVQAIKLLVKNAGLDPNSINARKLALDLEDKTGMPAGVMVLEDGQLVTGKTTKLLGCASSLLLNALKIVANIEDVKVLSQESLTPICHLKTNVLNSTNHRLHSDETLIALTTSSAKNLYPKKMIENVNLLKGCNAFFSVIISKTDEDLYKQLGINVSCEPKFETLKMYHK